VKALCIGAGKNTAKLSLPSVTPGIPLFPERTPAQWRSLQNMDPTLTRVIKYVQRGSLPNKRERQQKTKSVQQILRHCPRLSLVAGVLCRTRQDPKEVDPIIQLVLPEGERHIWQLYHEQAGHLGPEKPVSLIQRRFFWPQLSKEVTDRCAQCKQCVLRKAPNPRPAPLTPILTSAPLELLSVDFFGP